MTSKSISFKATSVERISSYGQVLSCPTCEAALMLKDTRDGDQAYWCHTCERGWRAGHLPPEARRAKAKALLETALGIEPEIMPIPEVVVLKPESVVKPKRVRKKTILEVAALSEQKVITIPKPETAVKTKSPRVAKAAPVVLETQPVIPTPRKPQTPKPILPEVVAQVMPEPVKQKSSSSVQSVKQTTNIIVQQNLFG